MLTRCQKVHIGFFFRLPYRLISLSFRKLTTSLEASQLFDLSKGLARPHQNTMNDVQYRRDRNLIKEFVPQSMRQSQISEGDAEGDVEVDGVTDIPSTRIGSKPSGESPEPFQNRFKDFDVPSLTNGSSCGSRTPSVTTDSEHSSAGLDIPSRDQEDLWPTLNPTMPCSSDPQAITE
jgi:hypothetical protein